MSFVDAVMLGLIQGLTEFLPVSSSGHLVLGEYLLGLPPSSDITFEVFVHFGTFLSVVVALWADVRGMLLSVLKLSSPTHWSRQALHDDVYLRLLVLVVVGTIPAGVIGIAFEESVGEAFADPKLVAVMLVLTGLVLFLTQYSRAVEGKKIGFLHALVIGAAQAVAILPGISRSGSTISTGMYLGIAPMEAARFSFLLALPAIGGATVLKSLELVAGSSEAVELWPILIGTVIAFGSGILAIKVLLRIVGKGKFGLFAYYCLVVGTIGIIFI